MIQSQLQARVYKSPKGILLIGMQLPYCIASYVCTCFAIIPTVFLLKIRHENNNIA